MSALARLLAISGAFILALAAYSLLAAGPAAAATPRVLAIRFGPDPEVNPVTKDYLDHQLDVAAKHYDAAASLRSLAATHKRNTGWPVLAVTKASNLTAQQALRMHVIDTIAPNLPALLRHLDGYRTKDPQRPFTLRLGGAQITTVSPGFFTRFL